MVLPTNRAQGDIIDPVDINAIAAEVNALSEDGGSGTVTSVNGVAPDANGNITLNGLDAGIQVGGTAPADGWWVDTGSDGGSVPATIPGKVTGLTAANASGVITLEWVAPADGGEPISDYTIRHKAATATTWETYTDSVSALTSAVLTGLPSGALRDFQVAAVNAVGTGTFSDTAQATPEAEVGLYVSDNFNRADASTLGMAVTGQTWGPGVTGTHARIRSSRVETFSNGALINAGAADVRVEADLQDMDLSVRKPRLIARAASSGGDRYAAEFVVEGATQKIKLRKITGGTDAVLATVDSPVTINAAGFRGALSVVEGSGSTTVTAYVDGTQVATFVDSGATRPTGTHVGFNASGNYGYFDNFTASDPNT